VFSNNGILEKTYQDISDRSKTEEWSDDEDLEAWDERREAGQQIRMTKLTHRRDFMLQQQKQWYVYNTYFIFVLWIFFFFWGGGAGGGALTN
jgi:hypothetical protein